MASYFTVRIPFVPAQHATEWHPTEAIGAFSTLTRGCFATVDAAIAWAKTKLNGTPYTIVEVIQPGSPDLFDRAASGQSVICSDCLGLWHGDAPC
jgi:hypothetical protein